FDGEGTGLQLFGGVARNHTGDVRCLDGEVEPVAILAVRVNRRVNDAVGEVGDAVGGFDAVLPQLYRALLPPVETEFAPPLRLCRRERRLRLGDAGIAR